MELIFDNRNKTVRILTFQNFDLPQKIEMKDKKETQQIKPQTSNLYSDRKGVGSFDK